MGKWQMEQIDELLDTCFVRWGETADKHGIQFRYYVNLSCLDYCGDKERIVHILDLVIGNCILASGVGGSVDIWVSDTPQGEDVNELVLTIEDNGVSETSISLIIAEKLVKEMGGRLKLEHRADMTNVLVIGIPLHKCLPVSGQKSPEEVRECPLQKYTFLLVGSADGGEHGLPEALLQLNGASTNVASGGEEALKWLENTENRADAVLLETGLGDMDYLEFAKRVRAGQQKESRQIPLIAVTEETSPDMIQEGMQSGINCWLDTITDIPRLGRILKIIWE